MIDSIKEHLLEMNEGNNMGNLWNEGYLSALADKKHITEDQYDELIDAGLITPVPDDDCDQNDHPQDEDPGPGGGDPDEDDGTDHPGDDDDDGGHPGGGDDDDDDGTDHPSDDDCYSTTPDSTT